MKLKNTRKQDPANDRINNPTPEVSLPNPVPAPADFADWIIATSSSEFSVKPITRK